MGLFKSLLGLAKAKSDEAAQKIEDENATSFAKQDLEKMKSDRAKVIGNLGQIKGRIMSLKDDIKEKEKEIKNRTAKATQLLDVGKEDLAQSQCAAVERIQGEVDMLKDSLKTQEGLCAEQQRNLNDLTATIQDCESQLRSIQTMEEVRKANDSLAAVDVNGSMSAAAKFKERQQRTRDRLNASRATAEAQRMGTSSDLDAQTNAALGKSQGSDLLEKLKAKKK